MQPIEKVLARLPDHKRSGDGFMARCPAHDDRNPSLSVREAMYGQVSPKCFAGCPTEKVVAAMGLEMRDLFPVSPQVSCASTSPRQLEAFSEVRDAIATYGLGEPTSVWVYTDGKGNEVGRAIRWPSATKGKECRPLCKVVDGWTLSQMPSPRPLLHLPALLKDNASPVFVVEGEKCVDALNLLGLLGTTSAGGSQAGQQTDWTPLAGRRVVILPDKDDAGDHYAETVRGILLGLGSEVQVAHLDGRPENGGDVADLLERCQTDADRMALKETLLAIAASPVQPGDALPPAPSLTAYRQFPTPTLSETVRAIVQEAAQSIGCDEAAIALPCLTALGVAAANWRIAIKDDWVVPPAVWTIIARPSGSQKSPALDISLDYFRNRQEELTREHGKAANKAKTDRPKTIWTDNATTEGLDEAFRGNPRGILYGCDELSGWLGTFGLYKSNGRSTSDEGWNCQRYGGRASHIVRKKDGLLHGCASGLLGVTGCTTVDTLRTLLTRSVRECGLMARLVICIPPESRRRWTDATVSTASRQRYYSLLDRLFADDSVQLARLSPDAKSLFRDFFDKHNEESERLASDDLRPAYSKLEELPARLALILHVAEGLGDEVSGDVMARAIGIVEWVKNETRRAYAILRPRQPAEGSASAISRLANWVSERGSVTPRDVQMGFRACRKSVADAKAALDSLVATGDLRKTPEGDYQCAGTGNPAAASSPPTPAPVCPSVDTVDVLTGKEPWIKL